MMPAAAGNDPQPDPDLIKKWLDVLYANHEPGQWLSLFAVDRQDHRDDNPHDCLRVRPRIVASPGRRPG